MDIDNKPIKNSNIWSSIVNDDQESDTDSELKHDEPDNDYCRATRVDGHPCNALRYKNELFCYSHLLSQKTRPRGRPKKVAPAVTDLQECSVRAPSTESPQSSSLNDDLVLKLSDKLKMKIDAIDTETKMLLKLLL